jgi:hypothetical protein
MDDEAQLYLVLVQLSVSQEMVLQAHGEKDT